MRKKQVANTIDVTDAAFKANPFPFYAQLRAESPVFAVTVPYALDITRENSKHLAFGQSIHYCLGAPLARLEGQIAINTLIQRMPDLRLSIPAEQVRWRSSFVLRGLEALPVAF